MDNSYSAGAAPVYNYKINQYLDLPTSCDQRLPEALGFRAA